MRKSVFYTSIILLLAFCQSVFAGNFFNLSSSGASANISINLCLNAKGPLTCQKYTVSALDLSILSAVPNRTYSFAGIKIITPGYKATNCTPLSNGYCMFSVNDKTGTTIPIISTTDSAPSTPSNIQATPGTGEVTISWSPSSGSQPIRYTVNASPFVAPPPACVNTLNTSCTFTGLTNGVAYTFTVVAENDQGTSSPSSPTSPVTPANPPGAPTGVTATGGNAQAALTWTAPVSDGGSAIIGYTVTSSPGVATPPACTNVGSTGCTFTGLTNGVAYTFTVTARNAIATGPASVPSNSVTPATVPGAPTSVSGTRGNTQVVLTWVAPASNGGSAITGYTVTSSPVVATPPACTNVNALGCTFTGLSNGTAYTFTVVAINAVGTGPASAPSSAVTPATLPGAPQNVGSQIVGTAGGILEVYWDPGTTGGSPITGYTVTSNPFIAPPAGCVNVNDTFCNYSGLTNGTPYTFTVTATNSVGTGPASAPSDPVAPASVPGAPTNVTGTVGNRQVTVAWTAPVNDGSSAITGYTVTSSPAVTRPANCANTPNTDCLFYGLTNGTPYTFTVVAINAIGSSVASAPSSSVTPVPPIPVQYAATQNGDVVISLDSGTVWTPTAVQPDGSPVRAAFVKDVTLYAGTNNGNVALSTNNGASWTLTTQPDGSAVNTIFVSGSAFYAGTTNGNVAVSTDFGTSWTPTAQPDTSAVNSIFIDGVTLYAGTLNGNVEISTDGGASWSPTTAQPDPGNQVLSIFVQNGVLYAGTSGGNVAVSSNNGLNWTLTTQPDTTAVHSVFVRGATLYAATAGGNVEVSTNGGTSWTPSVQPDGSSVNGFFINSNVIWSGRDVNSLPSYSRDEGFTWTQTSNPFNGLPVRGIVTSGSTIYICHTNSGVNGRVSISRDAGVTWIPRAMPGTGNCRGMAINGTTLYAGSADGFVAISTTEGVSWTQTAALPASGIPYTIAFSGNTLYAGTTDGNVYFTTDGITWIAAAAQPSPGFGVYTLFANRTSLFAGLIGDGNLRITVDNGTNWTSAATAPFGLSSRITGLYILGSTYYAAGVNGAFAASPNSGSLWVPRPPENSNDKVIYISSFDFGI